MRLRGYRFFAAAALLGCVITWTVYAQGAAGGSSGQAVAQTQGNTQSISEKIAASKGLLDINTATAAELNALPGMGSVYAQRVIAGRPYSAKNQLVNRGILPEDEYLKIKEYVIAHRVKK